MTMTLQSPMAKQAYIPLKESPLGLQVEEEEEEDYSLPEIEMILSLLTLVVKMLQGKSA